jgi:outer membrane protein, heavy metal efflux system
VQRAVRRDTALAWITRLTAEKKLAQFAQLEQENRLLAEAVRARIASGQARVDEAVMPKQEALKLADQRDELHAQQQQASAALQRWLGQAASEQEGEPLDAAWPTWPVERSALQARLHQHPELAVFAPRDQVLAAEMREAEAAKHPDWGVALAYQRRGQQYGDMVSAEFSFDLPVFAASRQDPRIAEKQAERVGLEAEREDMLRQHTEELERDLAEYERLERMANRQRDALLPLLASKLDLLLASYRAGKAGLAEVIAVRAESQAAQLQLIELEGQLSMAAARLHFVYGEDAE